MKTNMMQLMQEVGENLKTIQSADIFSRSSSNEKDASVKENISDQIETKLNSVDSPISSKISEKISQKHNTSIEIVKNLNSNVKSMECLD